MIRRRWCVPSSVTEELVHISNPPLKKIPQPSDLGYLFWAQYGGNNLRLRGSMYFVEMTLAGGLREETPDACV
jgi:hypothetical protein